MKEDIENLGWKFFGAPLKEDRKTYNYPIVFVITKQLKEGQVRLKYENEYTLCLENNNNVLIKRGVDQIFNGYVDNISKLKHIMKKLNIQ